MLHTKFRGNRPAGSREEDFKGVLPYMGMAAILVPLRERVRTHKVFTVRRFLFTSTTYDVMEKY